MKFIINKNINTEEKQLVYNEEDYSFDVEPHDGSGFTSIMINDLRLEMDDQGKIVYVWGLCPLFKCKETNTVPKKFKSYGLIALLETPPIPGISYRLNENERWSIYINKKEGWICIGDPNTEKKEMIEFISNCIATLDDQEITAIWLKPKQFPRLDYLH